MRAAIELVTQAGSIDAVAIDDIASQAQVSRRTFFNHYASKNAALLEPIFTYRSLYLAKMLSAPQNLSLWQAVEYAITATITETPDLTLVAQSDFILRQLVHASSSSPDIPYLEAQRAHQHVLNEHLAERIGSGDPLAIRLIAGVGEHMLRLCLHDISASTREPEKVAKENLSHVMTILQSQPFGSK